MENTEFCNPLAHLFGPGRGRGFRGGFGFGGGFGRFGGGPLGGGGPMFGAGKKLIAADLQLLVLGMLEEKPRHGYELIKELEERSHGFYTPSPGVIYPALTYLEELGYASVETSGTKKLYSITEEGKKYLQENRDSLQDMYDALEHISRRMEKMQRFMASEERGDDDVDLRHVLHEGMH